VRFDETINSALAEIQGQLGNRRCPITLVRDVAGQLTAVLEDGVLEDAELERLATTLDARLGRFSPGPERVLLRRSDLIDQRDVLESPDRVRLPDAEDAWLIDRLLTNQEWLRRPQLARLRLPVATAFSLKGGVGRSTAVAVWAWYLARQGHRVVAVDLDLEAPGLGSLLVSEPPAYGMVDWLVEALLEQPGQELLDDCLAFSPVADDAEGVIQVLPAFGAKTQDYVAKIGRVYLPGLASNGGEIGLPERIHHLIATLAERQDPPDVVLLDSRAGLHDIGAAAVTQLGAEVFLFARDEPQSWRAYRLLFEHLSRSAGLRFGMPDDDLRWRLKMVAAQVDKTEGAVASWLDASYDTWSRLYDDEGKATEENPAVTFVRDDTSAPHHPLTFYYDGGLRGLGLVDVSLRPPWPVVEAAFGEFLVGATRRLLTSHRTSGDVGREEG
jgi:MinD-like ATPase involved in chromosome partitioning or flagellar assembly